MENFDNRNQSLNVFSDSLDDTAKSYLLDTAKWAKFLAVVSFIFLGLFIIGGLYVAFLAGRLFSSYSSVPSGLMGAVYILIGVLYFFPAYYLFKFATAAKPALRAGDGAGLTKSLGYLRAAFRFVGIMLLIILIIYGIIILIAIISLLITRS